MKKVLIVSPYLDHLGGGERYMLSVASVLEALGHEIYFAWDNLAEITHLAEMLGITLKHPQLSPRVKSLYFGSNPLRMFLATRPYDIVVYLSDGSLPLLGGKRNIIHMQVPFHGVGGKSWQNRFKKRAIDHVIVNSRFTKRVIDAEYGLSSTILYPPVNMLSRSGSKTNTILSVGRFEPSLNAKKQDILIQTWRALSPLLPNWKLVLAGASASEDWVANLKKMGEGLPIEFSVNASHDQLTSLYSEAKIYWHAAGYGIDESKNPELTEHFGISTVEAVSAGCIPLVVPYGGQREIVTNTALHWTTKEQLMDKTLSIVKDMATSDYLQGIDIEEYSYENFAKNLAKLVV